jgi:hypothetical protein
MRDVVKILVGLALIVFFIAIGPWLVIYALNDFGQYLWPERVIPFNLSTWFSVIILGTFLRANVSVKR